MNAPDEKGAVASAQTLSDLRSAREKLCRAMTLMEWPGHRRWLQESVDSIDRIGVFLFPNEWSSFAEPPLPGDGE